MSFDLDPALNDLRSKLKITGYSHPTTTTNIDNRGYKCFGTMCEPGPAQSIDIGERKGVSDPDMSAPKTNFMPSANKVPDLQKAGETYSGSAPSGHTPSRGPPSSATETVYRGSSAGPSPKAYKLKISETCLRTRESPCVHGVSLEGGPSKLSTAGEIVQLLLSLGHDVPQHFLDSMK